MVGLFSLGMLVGGLIALYYRPSRPMVTVALCGTTASAPMIALALGLSPGPLLVVWFVRGIAIGVFSAIWDTTLQRHIAYESMARVSSWDWMTAGGLWPIGLVIAGPVAQALGVTETLWLSAGFGVVFSLWVLFVRDVWRLRGPQAPASRGLSLEGAAPAPAAPAPAAAAEAAAPTGRAGSAGGDGRAEAGVKGAEARA